MVFVLIEIYILRHMKVSVEMLLFIEGFWKLKIHLLGEKAVLSLRQNHYSAEQVDLLWGSCSEVSMWESALLLGQEQVHVCPDTPKAEN